MLFKWYKTGLLEFATLLAALLWIFSRYQHTLNQLHPEWILLAVVLGVFWCLRHNLYLPLFLLLLIAAILLHQWLVVLPSSVNWLKQEISAESTIMLNGRIQQRILKEDTVRLQLSSVELSKGEKKLHLPEAVLYFPKKRRRIYNFYRGRHLQVIGQLSEVSIDKNRLNLGFADFRYRNAIYPQSELFRKRNSWVRQLTDRAEFHLSSQALALYLPLTLAKRSYGSRSTAKVFQETGMAHLLAISGLHIGLIYGIILGLVRGIGRLSIRFLEHPRFYAISQLISLVRNLAVSVVNWYAYSGISCGIYVELTGCRTFARSSSSTSLRLVCNSILLHFPESRSDLRSFISTLISRGFIYSVVPPTLSTPWTK